MGAGMLEICIISYTFMNKYQLTPQKFLRDVTVNTLYYYPQLPVFLTSYEIIKWSVLTYERGSIHV